MIPSKAVTVASLLMATFTAISSHPGIVRERHVIHAPIKIKTIHHYKLKKIPIIIRKHVHYYKPREEVDPKPVVEEHHANHAFHDGGEGGGHYDHHEIHQHPEPPPKHEESFHGDHGEEEEEEEEEEDYEEHAGDAGHAGQSQEEEYEDYEYE